MQADRGRFLIEGHAEHGDTFAVRIFGRDIVFTRDPALINAINVTHASSFYKPAQIKFMWEPFLGRGPGAQRRAVVEASAQAHPAGLPQAPRGRLRQHHGGLHRAAAGGTGSRATQRDVRADLLELALEIVTKTLFDIDIAASDASAIHRAMVDVSERLVADSDLLIPRPRWWPTEANRRKYAAIRALEDIIARVLEERRTHGEDRGDLFSHMVFARDEQGGMSDKQLRDEAMTLIFAGHETTAHALTWTWYLLAKHPEVAARVREELQRVVGGGRVGLEHLSELTYLESVIKESLRVLPSVWAYAREAQEDLVLGRLHLEARHHHHHLAPGHGPQRDLLPGRHPLHARALDPRVREEPAKGRVHPVRGRTARVPGQAVRHDGDDHGAGHHAARVRAQPGGRLRARLHHRAVTPPGRARHADGGAAGARLTLER
jgi:cytochrome P450